VVIVGGAVLVVGLIVLAFDDGRDHDDPVDRGDRSDNAAPSTDQAPTRVFELGVTTDDGRVQLDVPECRRADPRSVRISEHGGPMVWQANADEPTPLDQLVIGVAPEGFDEVVGLAKPLDADTTYDAELWVGYPGVERPSLLGGARTTFVPDDLRSDRTWVAERFVAPNDYQSAACPVSGG
jgi:hypothetical protein